MERKYIEIKGACEHNLKSIDIDIPKKELVVITGVSGSGKSSLAFDTLYAEGQRRYVESLSSYARQFIGQMEKPKYETIKGLSPAISIEQKATSKNPRSTVGTITEIHDYLRVLYARMGRQHCWKCGRTVSRQSISEIVDVVKELEAGQKFMVLAPLVINRKGQFKDKIDEIQKGGFLRYKLDGELYRIEERPEINKNKKHNLSIVVDRLVMKEGIEQRLSSSIETALRYGEGVMLLDLMDGNERFFSEHYGCPYCQLYFPELAPPHFSFNSPLGFCDSCNGLGFHLEPDPDRVIVDRDKPILGGAIKVTIGEKGSWSYKYFRGILKAFGVDGKKTFNQLTEDEQILVLYGTGKTVSVPWESKRGKGRFNSNYEGVINTLKRRYRETESDDARKYYHKYFTPKKCSKCGGTRLNKVSRAVTIRDHSIVDVAAMTIREALQFFNDIKLKGNEVTIGSELFKEIRNRLMFLKNVGLDYLTLSRTGATLSGGEAQRIRLASQIGSELTGVIYILDEPSIGLHQRDNNRLIETLKMLRDKDNTVIVIEHDKDTMMAADHLIDIGPGAGIYGGEIVFQGRPKDAVTSDNITGLYLSGKKEIPIPPKRRKPKGFLTLRGVTKNNLNSVDVDIPVGVLTLITGVSGAGKSTLVNGVLYPAIANLLHQSGKEVGKYDEITGLEQFDKVINIDQSPIGRTPRSNPATYTKLFDHVRSFFAQLPESKARGYTPGRFSFNVKGGRCEACKGDGSKKIEMHFLADVYVPCEICKGKRFNTPTLEVQYKGHSIADILNISVRKGMALFEAHPKVYKILKTLDDVGMGYVALGQASTTLSGGEAQRIKLSRELAKRDTGKTLYILDEPSTGLHFADIDKLLKVVHQLVDKGNSVVMIEHNLDIIKTADYLIDMGPEGGDQGGDIVFAGLPEDSIHEKRSYTGQYLKAYL